MKAPANDEWDLRLYIAGHSSESFAAITMLRTVCEEHLLGRYRLEVIDLLKAPHLAASEQLISLPILVRKLPHPVRRLTGFSSSPEELISRLQINIGEPSGGWEESHS